jgi:twitching motility protein PilT
MLAQHHGDQLVLTPGKAPRLTRSGAPLRLFFPQVDAAMYDLLLGDLLTAERRTAVTAGERPRFEYALDGIGTFDVQLAAQSAQFSRRDSAEPATAVTAQLTAIPPADSEPTAGLAPAPAASVQPSHGARSSDQLAALVEHVISVGASDLHLADGEQATVRIDGQLRPLGGTPGDVTGLLAEQLDEEARAQLEAGLGVDRALTVAGTRLRLHIYTCETGLAAALRVLRRRAPKLAELNLPADLAPLAALPHGLVIVTGPTGSGKSTTLAALAQEALRQRRGLLVTLEDPIEYTYELPPQGALVRQRQVGAHVRDFPSGLRDVLREDPDVILIGEMRDPESIQLALTAAETGHLVLTSLHARTAASAVERIVDAYPPGRQTQIRVQLADGLRAVIAQRLLPRATGGGRVPALEILRNTRAVSHMIREGKTPQLISAIQTGAAEGMLPLERCLRDLTRSGAIDRAAAQLALGELDRPG